MLAQAERLVTTPYQPSTPVHRDVKPIYRGLSTRECRPGVSAGGRRVRLADDPNAESSSDDEGDHTEGLAIGYGSPLYSNDLDAKPMNEGGDSLAGAGSSFKVFFKSALRPTSKQGGPQGALETRKTGPRVQILDHPPQISTTDSPGPISSPPEA